MLVRIDEQSDRPIYAQIADAVRLNVVTGRIDAGQTLPPAREVAIGLGINVHTVLHAYQLLRDEGLVDLRRRRGAVVTTAAARLTELRDEVDALLAHAAELGIAPALVAALVERSGPPEGPGERRADAGSDRAERGAA